MFQVRNLTITHKKDLTTLVERLSFVLAPGDRAAIIGEEGNGKSTVLKLLYDSSLVEPYVEWTGEVMDNGTSKRLSGSGAEAGRAVGSGVGVLQSSPAFQEADPGALSRCAGRWGWSWTPFTTGGPCPPCPAGSV